MDAVLGVRKGWVCKRLASGLTCLPITAVEVVQVVEVVLPWLRPLCEQGEKMLEVKRGSHSCS